MLEFLLGTLLKDVADASRIEYFKNKKDTVENYQLFENTVILPIFATKIFTLQEIRSKFNDDHFTENNKISL